MAKIGPVPPDSILRLMSPEDRAKLGKAGMTAFEAKARAVAKDERELQKLLVNFLRLRAIWFTQSRMDRPTSNTIGTPDFLFCYRGRFVAWEAKCPWSKVLRTQQQKAAEAILGAGGQWRLISSVDDARCHLDELDQQAKEVFSE